MAITTVALLTAHLGARAVNYTSDQLTAAANAANAAVEGYCDLTATATDYAEWYDGVSGHTLTLRHGPAIYLYRCAFTMTDGVAVKNTSSDMVGGTVSVLNGVLNLSVFGGTNAGNSQLTLATYATLALLGTAAAALGKGWSFTVRNEEEPKAIRPGVYSVKTTNDEITLDVPYGADDAVVLRPAQAQVYRYGGWPRVPQAIYVNYKAGYDTIPADLTTITNQIAGDILWTAERDGGLQSETLGNYSWTAKAVSEAGIEGRSVVLPYAQSLARFKRFAVGNQV